MKLWWLMVSVLSGGLGYVLAAGPAGKTDVVEVRNMTKTCSREGSRTVRRYLVNELFPAIRLKDMASLPQGCPWHPNRDVWCTLLYDDPPIYTPLT